MSENENESSGGAIVSFIVGIVFCIWMFGDCAGSPGDDGFCHTCDGDGVIMMNGATQCPICEGDGRLDR